MKKRILALFLACMMIVSVIAVPAFAETDPCADGHDKTYTSMETGKKVPVACTDGTVVCSWTCKNCDETGYERVTGAHSLTTGLVEATCTSPAKAGQYCTACDYQGAMETVKGSVELGHDWKIDTEAEDYQAPTCDEPGKASFYCSRCDATKPAETIVPVAHSWDMVGIVEATCAHGAGIQYKCLLCGDTNVVEFTDGSLVAPATGHTPGEATNKDATCAEEGYTGRVLCTVCGEIVTEGTPVPVDNTKHTKKLVETLKAPTCTATGVGKYECKDCEADLGYMAIPAAHTWDAGVVTTPATCGQNGVLTFTCIAAGCKNPDNNNKPFTKTETILASEEHTIVKNKLLPADCFNNERVAAEYCSVCKKTWNVVDVPNGEEKLDHVPVNKIDCTVGSDGKIEGAKPAMPTCYATGWGYQVCGLCNTALIGSKTNAETLPKLEHKLGEYKHYEADCDYAAGVRAYCTNSGCTHFDLKVYTQESGLAQGALGHILVANPAADRAGTCYQTAITGSQKCSRTGCSYKVAGTEGSKNMNNHGTKLKVDYLKKPTCEDTGVGMFTCSNSACSSYLEYKSVPAAHTWDAGVVTTQPNCGTAKVTKYTCTALIDGKPCGATKTETGSTSGSHTWVQNTPVAATCDRAEGTASVCFTCGSEKDYVATANKNPLPHVWTVYIDCVADNTTTPDADDKDGLIDGKKPAYPTCTTTGWGYIKCSRCGDLQAGTKANPVEIATKAHNLNAGVHADATCFDPAGVRKDCADCDYYEVAAYTAEGLKQDALGHDFVEVDPKAATCMYRGWSTRKECKRCGSSSTKWIEKNPDNHVYVLVSTLKAPTCTTVGVGQYACKNPDCAGVTYFGSIAASHTWNEKEILVSESGNALYNPCTVCDAVKVMADLANEDGANVGKILNSLVLDAKVQVTGAVNKNAALAIQVSNIAGYTNLWIEVNGVKVADGTVDNGVYTFVYKTAVSNIDDTFEIIVKGEKFGVVCTSEATTYEFELLEDEFTVEVLATTKIENAAASFQGRGVLIGETVKLMYLVEAPETASVVLKKYGTDTVFATVKLADLTAVNGVYVVEIEVAADDWDQVFSASVVDAEGNVISNTNHYSVAQYAANNIKGTDKLSTVLSAMMQAIAD